MLIKNGTYFNFQNCTNPHFVIFGHEDWTCNDDLQIITIDYDLYKSLKENGFEAVIFVDGDMTLRAFDEASANFMRTLSLEGVAGEHREGSSSSTRGGDPGPLGFRVVPRRGGHQQTVHRGSNGDYSLTLDLKSTKTRMEQILTQNEVRCALIFTDYEASSQLRVPMTGDSVVAQKAYQYPPSHESVMPEDALRLLGEHDNGNGNIAIYRFRDTKSDFIRQLGVNQEDIASFYKTIIYPALKSDNENERRSIHLCTPNAREIRNLLLRAKLYGNLTIDSAIEMPTSVKLKIGYENIDDIAFKLADFCANKNIGIADLAKRITDFMTSCSETLTSENYGKYITDGSGTKFRTAMDELDSYIGMEEFKKSFKQLAKSVDFANSGVIMMPAYYSRFAPRIQPTSDDKDKGHSLNVVLKGEPGTGKTTVARLIGRLYREIGVLPQGHIVEVSAGNLMGVNEGEAADRVHDKVLEALGGVLFIDEVYNLIPDDNGTSLGQSVINQLVNDMSTYMGQFAVVIAGYAEYMPDLMAMNDGLARRFPNNFLLTPYNGDELRRIFLKMIKGKGYELSQATQDILEVFFKNWAKERLSLSDDAERSNWGNAGEVESLTIKVGKKAADRLSEEVDAKPGKIIIEPGDFPEKVQYLMKNKSHDDIIRELDEIIGLEPVKARIRDIIDIKRIQKGAEENEDHKKKEGSKQPVGGFVFYGRPGTGKSMMAKVFSELLWDADIIKKRNPEIVNAKQLISGEVPLDEAVRRARGGILFIDEAHQLNEDNERAREVLTQLVPYVSDEEIKMDTGFVLAGYRDKLEKMLDDNTHEDGLTSRFPEMNRMHFPDYSAEELTRILEMKIKAADGTVDDAHYIVDENGNHVLDENGKQRIEEGSEGTFGKVVDGRFRITSNEGFLFRSYIILRKIVEHAGQNFGNGRYIENTYLPLAEAARGARLKDTKDPAQVTKEDRSTFTVNDLPRPRGPEGRDFIISEIDLEETLKSPLDELRSVLGKEEAVKYIIACGDSSSTTDTYADDTPPSNLVFGFAGPMGCGKSTLCRAMAKYFHSTGVIEYDTTRFFDRGSLEAGYVGQSSAKTTEIMHNNAGSVIVLTGLGHFCKKNESDSSFAPDILGAVSAAISGLKKTCFVFMDTEDAMEAFLKEYPNFGTMMTTFKFKEYSAEDMLAIFKEKTRRMRIRISDDKNISDEELLRTFFYNWVGDKGGLGARGNQWRNGTEVENLVDKIRRTWDSEHTGDDIETGNNTKYRIIRKHMFPRALQKYFKADKINPDNLRDKLGGEIGLENVKRAVYSLRRRIMASRASTVFLRNIDPAIEEKFMADRGISSKPGKFIFMGNPGTGKTRMAKYFGTVLKATGALKQGHVITLSAASLMSEREAPKKLREYVDRAKEGILFIDEAHNLGSNNVGIYVIKELLTIVEEPEIMEHVAIILAGYKDEMTDLIQNADEGLSRRFGEDTRILFEDYDGEQLFAIAKYMMENAKDLDDIESPYTLFGDESFDQAAQEALVYQCNHGNTQKQNAGYSRNFVNMCYDNMIHRLFGDSPETEQMGVNFIIGRPMILTADDIPEELRPKHID